jgi:pyridoxine 4-dehydrogenase
MTASTVRIGSYEVRRMGFGAMRLPGEGVWGEPRDPAEARAVLRRAIELGVQLIDTSWYYGPWVSNRLIVEALHPYPRDLVIATKLGAKRLPDKSWVPYNRPEELVAAHVEDLASLRLERSHVTHFRALPGSAVPFAESLGALIELQKRGLVEHIAVSNVTLAELELARAACEIVAVQNPFSIAHSGRRRMAMHGPPVVESPDLVLDAATAHGIAFLPYFPLAMGNLGKPQPRLDAIAARHGVTGAQLALAWLLHRSPMMLPIPGTSRVAHLDENWNAQRISLSDDEMTAIAGEG